MKAFPVLTDPVYVQKDSYNFLDRFFVKLIRDERDLPFVHLTLQISLIMIPIGILTYLPFVNGALWWGLAAAYFITNNFVFKAGFGLMLHCTSHRKFFKKEYDWLNKYLPWIVGPFFGQTPNTYFSHHIGMHHRENNLPEDESSTMHYQRDNFGDFMKYFGNFMMNGLTTLISYLKRTRRGGLAEKARRGEVFFLILVAALCFVNLAATISTFVLPFFISRFIMMLGNWTQHAFIDPTEPGNHYKNSITCVNVKYNHKAWNDGYHISHHIKPSMHWTLHPEHLLNNKEKYAANDAIIFDKLDFLKIFIHLMRKNYDVLAENFVNIDNRYGSNEEVIALLKKRTQKFSPEAIATFA